MGLGRIGSSTDRNVILAHFVGANLPPVALLGAFAPRSRKNPTRLEAPAPDIAYLVRLEL